ncbi:MAG: pitrilysin family protein [bacterium]|nr:pitrilysin family protein [bacterium]
MEFERFRLSNGIPVVVSPISGYAPVVIQAWFSCGSRTEEKHENGLAHFNEHMFFRGGRDFPDAESVERELRLLGDVNGAFTNTEWVFYSMTVSPLHFRRAMRVFSDMLVFGRMPADSIEKERNIIIQERKRAQDDRSVVAEEEFEDFLFGDQPLGRRILGTEETIRSFTRDDVLGYKERYYGYPNMVLVVAGGTGVDEAYDALEEHFGIIVPRQRVVWRPFVPPDEQLPVRFLRTKEAKQAHLFIGGFAPSLKSPDAYAVEVLCKALSSRLWSSVRLERALAYNVSAESTFYADCGLVSVSAAIDSEERAISSAIKLIFSAIRDMTSGNISDAEIDETKTMLHSGFDLSFESVTSIAAFLGGHELQYGRAKTPRVVHEEIDRVTKADLIRLAGALWQEEIVSAFLLADRFPRFENKYCELRKMLR